MRSTALVFIEAVEIDKVASLSWEALEAMLNLDSLRKSKVYQEAFREGFEEGALATKLKTIPKLIRLGLNVEQIAEFLELDIQTVKKSTQQLN